MSQRSPYDYRLNQHESLAAEIHNAYVGRLESNTREALNFTTELNRYDTLQSIAAEKELIKEVTKSELEALRQKGLSWSEYRKMGRRFS